MAVLAAATIASALAWSPGLAGRRAVRRMWPDMWPAMLCPGVGELAVWAQTAPGYPLHPQAAAAMYTAARLPNARRVRIEGLTIPLTSLGLEKFPSK